jgi:polyisoprenoid-binding protein YceI
MKKTILVVGVAAVAFLASCSSSNSTEAKDSGEAAQATSESVTYTVDAAASSLQWTGSKLFDTKHTGTVVIKEGSLSTTNGQLSSGNFIMDMTTIIETNPADAEMSAKLVGHLSSPAFFDNAVYPTARFEIVEVSDGNIKGNLTIKDSTKLIEFPVNVEMNETGITASSSFTINRNDWGITWGSAAEPIAFLKDNLVKEEVEFAINLVANK